MLSEEKKDTDLDVVGGYRVPAVKQVDEESEAGKLLPDVEVLLVRQGVAGQQCKGQQLLQVSLHRSVSVRQVWPPVDSARHLLTSTHHVMAMSKV